MIKFKRIALAIIVAFFTFSMTLNSTASALNACSTVEECDAELDKIGQDVNNAKESLEKNKQDSEALQAQVKDYSNQINGLTDQIKTLGESITLTEAAIAEKETTIKKKEEIIFQQLKVQQKNSNNNSFLTLLMSSSSISDFMSRWSVIETLSSKEKVEVTELEDLKTDLQTLQEGQKDKKASLDASKSSLEASISEKQELQTLVKAKIAEEEAGLDALAASEAEIEAQRDILNRPVPPGGGNGGGSTPTNGSWSLPVSAGAVITARLWSPIYESEFGYPHRGTDIGMYYGAAISSIADGWVLASGYYGALGNVVAVGHVVDGVNYVSTYAHLSSIYVYTGQYVGGGEHIGAMGGSGASGPNTYATHVHIELATRDYFTTSIGVRNATNFEVLNVLSWEGYWTENWDAW